MSEWGWLWSECYIYFRMANQKIEINVKVDFFDVLYEMWNKLQEEIEWEIFITRININ